MFHLLVLKADNLSIGSILRISLPSNLLTNTAFEVKLWELVHIFFTTEIAALSQKLRLLSNFFHQNI